MPEYNYTELLFLFPIRIWGEHRYYNEEDDESKEKKSWVKGMARLPISEVTKMIYWEGLSSASSVDDYLDKGTDCTIIETENYGTFRCLWKRDKFEAELNKYIKRYNELCPSTEIEF